LRGL